MILDIMMPGMDGLRATLKLETKISHHPAFGKRRTATRLRDCPSAALWPFNPLELMARVKSQIRRFTTLGSIEVKEDVLVNGGLVVDLKAHEVTVDGEPVKLTATEYGIVEFLMRNVGRVFSTAQIYEAVWNEPFVAGEKTVTVHIRRIREKIEIDPKEPRYIKVVWGVGYKIEKQ